MLEDCLIESRSSVRRKNPLTLVVSVATHGSLIAALILIPLFQEQLLPHIGVFEPLPPPMVQVRAIELVPAQQQSAPAQAPAPAPSALLAPLEIPREIVRYTDQPSAVPAGFLIAGPGGPGNVVGPESLFGIAGGGRDPSPPPPPPVAPPPAPPKLPDAPPAAPTLLRRGGDVMKSSLVTQVMPVYPVLAAKSRTEGAVTIEAVITRQGTIDPTRVRVLKGHILLDQAAIDAILQWRYKPTLLNGEPVEILTNISINFTLAR